MMKKKSTQDTPNRPLIEPVQDPASVTSIWIDASPPRMRPIPPSAMPEVKREASSMQVPRHPLNPDRLARVPIESVSEIAATIRNDSPHESIRKAYELLDIAASAQAFLDRSDKQSFEAGIDHHLTITEQKRKFEKNLPMFPSEVDSEGNRLNVPWETLIANLYPDGRVVKRDERETRLKKFVCAIEDIDENDLITKGERLGQLQRDGVAPELARTISVCFHAWYDAKVSGGRSDAGSKGGKKSKGGQGAVKSNSDGRLGSKVKPEDLAKHLPDEWRA